VDDGVFNSCFWKYSFFFVLDFRKTKGMGILKGEQIHSSLAAHLYGSFVHSWMDGDG
jgi:hypothetical protein